jgi:hypothetical protein
VKNEAEVVFHEFENAILTHVVNHIEFDGTVRLEPVLLIGTPRIEDVVEGRGRINSRLDMKHAKEVVDVIFVRFLFLLAMPNQDFGGQPGEFVELFVGFRGRFFKGIGMIVVNPGHMADVVEIIERDGKGMT